MKCEEIKKRYDQLVAERKGAIDSVFDLIEKFVVPFRGDFYSLEHSEHEINWRKRDIYDGTAVIAAQILAASMQGALTSSSIKWFYLRFRNDEINSDQAAVEWLQECENRVYAALQDSNFNLEASEFYLDLVSYGTAVIVEEVAGGQVVFQAVPVRDIYFDLDHRNHIRNLYRRVMWTPSQIISRFGEENVPEKIKARANTSTNDKIELIYCIYTRPDKQDADVSKPLAPSERPFGSKYVFAEDGSPIGDEDGYYEMPAFISRWRKVTSSIWGHSPAHVVLSDILTLNELTEATLEAIGKVVDPATIVTKRGLLSDLDLGRGGLTVVRNVDDIRPYESRARFDVADLKIDRLQLAINRAFHVDQLELKQSPAMTATEVQVRYELMQRLLGPTLGRLQNDFLEPLIQRTFNILLREGMLPDIPDIVAESGDQIDIVYTGPLPQSQKRDAARSTVAWLQTIAQLAEIFPEMRDIPDPDAIARELGSMEGVPAKLMKPQDDVDKERAARAQQAQMQQAAQMAEMAGSAAQKAGAGIAAIKGAKNAG